MKTAANMQVEASVARAPQPHLQRYTEKNAVNPSHKDRFLCISAALIEEAAVVMATKFKTGVMGAPTYVDLQTLHKWWGKVKSFGHQLGTAGAPWKETFATNPAPNTLSFAMRVLGTLEAIQYELEHDHLSSFTQLVKAETLADLLDQSQTLFDAGYHLAAGVIGRAVLEEHLRTTCGLLGCEPTKSRPTLADFNRALYGVNHYAKTRMKQIDALSSVGNDAAHNKPELDASDVNRMLLELPSLIESTGV
jgi:hypothetical protein